MKMVTEEPLENRNEMLGREAEGDFHSKPLY